MEKRLAIVTTHPIQYNAPWFKLLDKRENVKLRVFYTWSQVHTEKKFDPGFNKHIEWDIPLLEGYDFEFVPNESQQPGSHHRKGIINPTLISKIKSWKPDALLIFGWNYVSHWKCMRYFHGRIPIFFRGDSTFLRKHSFLHTVIRLLFLRWVYRHIDFALYVGEANRNYFLRCGLSENQLIFAPHAVENGRFGIMNQGHEAEIKNFKSSIGINNDYLTLLFAAKFEEIKNPFLFLTIANRFKEEPINFILAGNGPLEKELKAQGGSNSNLFFVDFQNQSKMPLLYKTAHYYFLSSDSETWGLAVNEAMAAARGVIVRNTCGCAADLVKDGYNGFVFDAADLETLFKKISSITYHPEIWKQMGDRSLQIIENFNFNKILDAVEYALKKSTEN